MCLPELQENGILLLHILFSVPNSMPGEIKFALYQCGQALSRAICHMSLTRLLSVLSVANNAVRLSTLAFWVFPVLAKSSSAIIK